MHTYNGIECWRVVGKEKKAQSIAKNEKRLRPREVALNNILFRIFFYKYNRDFNAKRYYIPNLPFQFRT